jgi:F420-dependent oxidoreductase-like protein
MRLGLNIGYSGPRISIDMGLVREAERLGFDSVWCAEAYGSDAVTPATWIAAQTTTIKVGTAIMQMPARTPAMAAMTATTLDQLSGGRFLMGIGASGPQVVEGWHGVPYGNPLVRVREYIAILRQIWAREQPLQYHGQHYQIPYRGPGATGLGKALKSTIHGRPIPIYVAAIRPRSVEQAAELADGLLPSFYSPFHNVYREPITRGLKKADPDKAARFDIAASAIVIQGDNVASCLAMVKPALALYVGGMGARGKNFYNELACRYGFEAEAKRIQDLYLEGKKNEAIAAVPDALADAVSLVGPKERIVERASAWKESGVTTLLCALKQPEAARTMAEALL